MLILVDKHSGVPVYRQILDQIKHQILTGMLKVGEPLMGVRDLAKELTINPMTVSKSYSLLEHEGFVERRKGVGLFVTEPKQELTRHAKRSRIEEALSHLAVQAIHLGFTEDEVVELLRQQYKNRFPKE